MKTIIKKIIPTPYLNKIVTTHLNFKKQYIPYLWSLLPTKASSKKFLIFGQGRTGSTLLVNILNSHPDIYCEGEIFNNAQNLGKGNILFPNLLLKGKTKLFRNYAYGFKVKIYQLTQQKKIASPRAFLKELANQNWKIIYLKRDNIFEHAMSNIRAEDTGVYHQFNKQSKSRKIKVDLNTLQRIMNERTTFLDQEKEILLDIKYCQVIYEKDLLNDEKKQETANRIFDFLDLPHHNITFNLNKINKDKWSVIISNYEEVKTFLESRKQLHLLNS